MPSLPFAQVAVALPVDGLFTYRIPRGRDLALGHTVLVPFGRQEVSGYVVGLTQDPGHGGDIKEISRLLDPEPAFDAQQLEFFRWMAGYYLVGLGEVIATALPASYRQKTRQVLIPTEEGIEALAAGAVPDGPRATVLREIVAHPGRTARGLTRVLGEELSADEIRRAAQSLRSAGLACLEEKDFGGPGGQVATVSLAIPAAKVPPQRGTKMQRVLQRLVEAGGTMDLADLVELEGSGARSAIMRLEAKGLLARGVREDRDAARTPILPASGEAFTPNDEQEAALKVLKAAKGGSFLLHGVTGSGKTEVYLQAAADVLEAGRQVVILVPEIALTPLLTGRVKARFGERVAVLHSGLTGGERLREWRRIRAGEVSVAVGARSALFAPFPDLGLIVVDEEHDDSYKQDDGVRYHARDLAVVRGKMAGCPVVLGSATPSVESWNNAAAGRYTMLRMLNRATPRPVPDIELLDMRGLAPGQALAPALIAALEEALAAGGKAIVLYNRRGYAPVVECPGCGAHYECPSCGVSLVYHRGRQRLQCHYCGFYRDYRSACPSCGSTFDFVGHGTERVEEELRLQFPGIGIARMDADTTAKPGAHFQILDGFRAGSARLLVGTQLVAKGHDFPDVHLAAVVGVDHVLMLPDFRSAERTYALVTQLAGRAGRGEAPGRVLVQTRHPDHFVFRLLAGEFKDKVPDKALLFYSQEIRQRRILRYPPFSRLVLLRIEGEDRDSAQHQAGLLAEELRRSAHEGRVDILGPVLAPLSRLVGRWRYQVILRGQDANTLRQWLAANRHNLRGGRGGRVRVSLDVDPRSLL